jgi:hypothetical protein
MQQNPDVKELFSDAGALSWLAQRTGSAGFTGGNAQERLANAGYAFSNVATTGIWEFLVVQYGFDAAALPTGEAAIDELMRMADFRQIALQPSLMDAGYAEADLPENWWTEGGYADLAAEEGAPVPVGRAFYMVVLYEQPHFEHVDQPVVLPKQDQTGVPLYAWSANRNTPVDGVYAPTQVSYPITFLMGSINPEDFQSSDANQYQAFITNASIVGPDNVPLLTQAVHPGDEPVDSWPSGRFLRTTLALYTRHPFLPDSNYTVYADIETPGQKFTIDYTFRTAPEDPGVDAQIGLSTNTTAAGTTSRRSSDHPSGSRVFARHSPPMMTSPGTLNSWVELP